MRLNKKIVPYILIIMFVLGGCDEGPKPSLKNTTDASLEVASDGSVSLRTEHRYEDGNVTTHTQSIIETKEAKKTAGYERVPDFQESSADNIEFEKEAPKKKNIVVDGKKVKISVESIPLGEFVDLVFSSVLSLNYTVTEDVKKLQNPITLNMSHLQPKTEVLEVVKKLLEMHGVTLQQEDGVIYVLKKDSKTVEDIKDTIFIGYGRNVPASLDENEEIIMFVPYYFIDPKKSVYILQQAGIDKSRYYYPRPNIQMVRDSVKQIRKTLEIISLIDKPFMEGKTPYLVDLEYVESSEFLQKMKDIYEANGVSVTSTPDRIGVYLYNVEALNSIYIITPKESWLDMLLYWKKKLDVIGEVSSEPKFYTYKVKNRKADELAEAVNSVMEIKLASLVQNKPQNTPSTTQNKTIDTQKKGNFKVVADLPTNTLMMELLPLEYRELLPLMEELDALPLQVLAEVTLAEVTLTDTFSLGFEYAIRNAETASPIADIELASAVFGGSGFAATYASKRLDATINAYAEDKLLNILSKPKILILNNETGSINVGTQIPIITSENSAPDTTNATTSSIMRNISYRNTGVIVGLTPTINSNGVLTIRVNLQLSEAQLNDTSGIDSPLIVNRSLSTTLTINDGESVMLGGLISKNKSTTQSGVPLLKDIPWLGALFASQSDKITKTELIILIKPYIIINPTEITKKTQDYTKLLELLREYSTL